MIKLLSLIEENYFPYFSDQNFDTVSLDVFISGNGGRFGGELYPPKGKEKLFNKHPNKYTFASEEMYNEIRDNILKMFNELPDPIPVFRIIGINNKKEIKLDDPGESWTFDLKGINLRIDQINFDFDKKYIATLKGNAYKKDVDWYNTIGRYLIFSIEQDNGGDYGENEITCSNVQDIEIIKIEKMM